MRNVIVIGSLALAATVWSGISAQQETQPRPGPGSGVSKVTGNVSIDGGVTIDHMPDVNAKQRGPWQVGITELPDVHVAGPRFVRAGGRYEVTWTTGQVEQVTVTAVASDGWVKVEHQRGRWINLRQARGVEALN